jgi:hypothetical protein
MKKFNIWIFLSSTLVVGALAFTSFIAATGQEEGNHMNMFWLFFARLFYIFRFPTHTIFWHFFSNSGATIFFGGLFINCALYGLIIERVTSLFNKNPSAPNGI